MTHQPQTSRQGDSLVNDLSITISVGRRSFLSRASSLLAALTLTTPSFLDAKDREPELAENARLLKETTRTIHHSFGYFGTRHRFTEVHESWKIPTDIDVFIFGAPEVNVTGYKLGKGQLFICDQDLNIIHTFYPPSDTLGFGADVNFNPEDPNQFAVASLGGPRGYAGKVAFWDLKQAKPLAEEVETCSAHWTFTDDKFGSWINRRNPSWREGSTEPFDIPERSANAPTGYAGISAFWLEGHFIVAGLAKSSTASEGGAVSRHVLMASACSSPLEEGFSLTRSNHKESLSGLSMPTHYFALPFEIVPMGEVHRKGFGEKSVYLSYLPAAKSSRERNKYRSTYEVHFRYNGDNLSAMLKEGKHPFDAIHSFTEIAVGHLAYGKRFPVPQSWRDSSSEALREDVFNSPGETFREVQLSDGTPAVQMTFCPAEREVFRQLADPESISPQAEIDLVSVDKDANFVYNKVITGFYYPIAVKPVINDPKCMLCTVVDWNYKENKYQIWLLDFNAQEKLEIIPQSFRNKPSLFSPENPRNRLEKLEFSAELTEDFSRILVCSPNLGRRESGSEMIFALAPEVTDFIHNRLSEQGYDKPTQTPSEIQAFAFDPPVHFSNLTDKFNRVISEILITNVSWKDNSFTFITADGKRNSFSLSLDDLNADCARRLVEVLKKAQEPNAVAKN